jgi:hypothetical protein
MRTLNVILLNLYTNIYFMTESIFPTFFLFSRRKGKALRNTTHNQNNTRPIKIIYFMTRIALPIVACLFCMPAFAQTPTLQDVTTSGRTTNQWLQITNANGVLSTGAGLELYGSSTNVIGYIKAYNRATSTPGTLKIQDSGGDTHINPGGGNVGIGTTNPLAPLHVSTPAGAGGIISQSTFGLSAGSGSFLRLYNSGTPSAVNQRLGGLLMGTNPSGNTLRTGAQIEAFSEAAWTDGVSQPSFMRFLTTGTGKVSPEERMRITADGNIQVPQGAQFGTALTDKFAYDGKTQVHYGMQWTMDSWNPNGPTLWAAAYGGMKFFTQGIPRITIAGDGNVGIGTTAINGYKLAVNGEAIFTRVKVKPFSGWPDYVFSRDYRLLSLQEVEKYIKDNNHLPNVPSATEVEKEGLDLAEMNKKLLQKVEELTLYIIEQQKTIDRLQAKDAAMESRLLSLEKK